MATATEHDPRVVIERLAQAMTAHDLEAMLSTFDSDYRSEQPVHPDRAFHGMEQVRKNWSAIFSSAPDFRANLLRMVVDANTVWSEWEWTGTHGWLAPPYTR